MVFGLDRALEPVMGLWGPRGSLAEIPGPRGLPALGNLLDFVRTEPHERLYRYSREYGDLCRFAIGPVPFLLANSPELIERVLVEDGDSYRKGIPTFAVKPIVRDSIFIVNKPQWNYGRAHHPYTSEYARSFFEQSSVVVREAMRERLAGLASGGDTRDLYAELVHATFDAFCTAILGEPMPEQQFENYLSFMRTGATRIKTMLPTVDPRFDLALHSWFGYLRGQIDRWAADPQAPGVFGHLATSGTGLSSAALLDEISTMITGGVHPVATALAAALHVRAAEPAKSDAAVRQARGLVKARPQFDLPDAEDLAQLDRYLLETLRLYSPVAVIARQVRPAVTAELGGFDVPSGTEVFISSWAMHRHPGCWKDPLVFNPSRFTKVVHGARYMPFGFGERSCVGQQFALMTARTSLVVLFGEYDVRVRADQPLRTSFSTGFVLPTKAMPATITSLGAVIA